jgi:nucleoside-diphosphate-sugar epimerase
MVMKVVVTGGAGYVGSVLCRRLLKEGHEVKCLDNLLYGIEPIQPLLSNPTFHLVEGDIRNMTTITNTIDGADAVIHLASIVGAQASDLNQKATMEINYLATQNIAELCTLHGIPRFIFASTCSVYGAQPDSTLDEDSPTPQPVDFYGQTKLKSEEAIKRVFPNATILRTATLFGYSYRMRFDLAVNRFIAQALQDKKVTVFGGSQFRPFLHVADIVEAYLFALNHNLEGIYNVHWENWRIVDIAKLITEELGAEMDVSTKIVDNRDYRVSSEKINKLGFKPQRTIQQAIKEISEHYKTEFKDYKQPKFENYGSIFNSNAVQSKIYTQGPIWK